MSHAAELPESGRRGLEVDGDDPVILARALELAFDYRGDVTLDCEGRLDPVVGYVFDRRDADPPGETIIRVIPADGGDRIDVRAADVRRLRFTGRDTAAGKSFETWMKKYVQKKLAGETASIESELLE